ncbi:15948_t:CDS:2 [Dentiscutata heterogama]|uniref:15948_t:CDS:1 n=1 Tax=Dentiscutata heterogama TaxID=1316150 RepID=A0ACA9KQG6_9GLOM|nr:15948_t:CDS:2 [Dentiscutata heterogama]
MTIKYTHHTNHIPGSNNDIGNLRISNEVRNWIADRIRDGLNVKGIHRLFQKRARDISKIWQEHDKKNAVHIRDNLVTRDDIYNIWKEVIKESQMKHTVEEQSIEMWRIDLSQNGDLTCTIPRSEENGKHDKGKLFGFTIPTGKEIIHEVSVILLDATHGTNKNKNLLYTLLSPDPKTGKGVTIAHLLSSHKNFESVHHWLYSLCAQVPDWQGPAAFLVDCDLAQIKALHVVFPESRVLLCWWHIARAWRENLGKAYKDKASIIGRKLNQNEKKLLGDELFADLKYLMNIDDINLVNEFLLNKTDEHSNVRGIDKMMWIKAYRTRIPYGNMDTTNMIESWHKRLKYDNFEGKVNRRRRMMPAEKEVCRRQLKAQALINTVLEVGNGGYYWTVASEMNHDIRYSVEKIFENKMTRDLEDLNIGRLEIVHNQLSRVLDEVRRIGDFQAGNWESEGQRISLPPNLNVVKQRR